MTLKEKITAILIGVYALGVISFILYRIWKWYKNDFKYGYYLLHNTYSNLAENNNNIKSVTFKIKARNENEAMGIFLDLTKDIEYTTKGDVECNEWSKLTYFYTKPKKQSINKTNYIMKKITNYIYAVLLPIYINIPFSNGKELAIWNCAARGSMGKKLTFLQNLKEIRITIRKDGSCLKVIKKGIY